MLKLTQVTFIKNCVSRVRIKCEIIYLSPQMSVSWAAGLQTKLELGTLQVRSKLNNYCTSLLRLCN
jgi:hypothetical protein